MSRAAIRYAKAIIDNAVSNGKTDSVNNDMNNIIAAINESHELEVFLASPVVPSEIKLNALFEIFSDSNEETKALFKLLSANKRFGILQEIALRYKTLYNEINGLEIAKVTTAVALTPELRAREDAGWRAPTSAARSRGTSCPRGDGDARGSPRRAR